MALKFFEVRDVRAALDRWWASTDRDDRGELRSRFLPAPGDLIPLIQAESRKHFASLDQALELVRRICPDCGSATLGFCRPGDDNERICFGIPRRVHETGEICGATLVVVWRGNARDDPHQGARGRRLFTMPGGRTVVRIHSGNDAA